MDWFVVAHHSLAAATEQYAPCNCIERSIVAAVPSGNIAGVSVQLSLVQAGTSDLLCLFSSRTAVVTSLSRHRCCDLLEVTSVLRPGGGEKPCPGDVLLRWLLWAGLLSPRQLYSLPISPPGRRPKEKLQPSIASESQLHWMPWKASTS